MYTWKRPRKTARNPHLKYQLPLKTKEGTGGGDLGLQRGERQFT